MYRTNYNYIYGHWIFYPATGYNNGYWKLDNYPYYVYNGYRYRYSSVDYCNYQLVDQNNHMVVNNYWNQICNTGYDACSLERDRLNSGMGEYRYFCSETYSNQYSTNTAPTYEDTYYSDSQSSADEDVMDDEYDPNCTDLDTDGYCDEQGDSEYPYETVVNG